jgi:hypothetical protein
MDTLEFAGTLYVSHRSSGRVEDKARRGLRCATARVEALRGYRR